MPLWQPLSIAIAAVLGAYTLSLLVLVRAGRRSDAVALARFIPDCLVLFRRLLADPRVPWPRKAALAATIAYLAMPLDLVPDFLPVAGQIDDALIVALALRGVLRGAGEGLLREHWPGPHQSLRVICQLV
jgi:uncharacterized membrane protein YkvA (DUF1232 family)